MIELYVIIALLVAQMLPKARFVADHKGIRIVIFYIRSYYSDPESFVEGFFEKTHCIWLKKNEEWWDRLKKG